MSLHRLRAEIASWRVIDDEAVVIHAETSEYFGLNQSGTWLWTRLAERALSADELASLLGARYGLAHESVAHDVSAFLQRLSAAHLLQDGQEAGQVATAPSEDAARGAPDPSPGEEGPPLDPYEPPEITRFGDLETLILSGE